MTLPINPQAKLVATLNESITKATNDAQAAASGIGNLAGKLKLDEVIAREGGALGSGLNGASAGEDIGKTVGGMQSALNGISKTVQTGMAGAISSLRSAAGSTSNIAADVSGSLNKLTGGGLAGGALASAGTVSKSAGMFHNLLSKIRGKNLPAGGEVFAQKGPVIELSVASSRDWRVRINANFEIFDSGIFSVLQQTGGVVFPFMPNITVSTKADYTSINPTHSNYTTYSYKGSMVDDITISGEFPAEDAEGANYWIAATTFFKTATKMFFGQGERAGNPPIICNLSGYGSSVFDRVPVIIKDFSVELKDDVNYIRVRVADGTDTWVPALSTITIKVSPVYNRAKLRQFSLEDYAKGQTTNWDDRGVGYL